MPPAHRIVPTAALLLVALSGTHAFVPSRRLAPRIHHAGLLPPAHASSSDQAEREAANLMEKVRKMRAEIAALEGRSVEEVEDEATERKRAEREREERTETERAQRDSDRAEAKSSPSSSRADDGRYLEVPDTFEDQVRQAADASGRAFRDGVNRQIVRFELLPEDETLRQEERGWPGGAEQMYRRAAGPLTRALLSEVRAPTNKDNDALRSAYRPNITSEDVWDFDGSAIITAEAATGSEDNVKALVFPNTDNKYSNDIKKIDENMGDRLFMLVNPFWRNLDSWGFNILAPKGKEIAQEAIFDRGFNETYVLLQKSVRGEDCIALKAYPYDWQLFAYAEDEYWPYNEYSILLGSTENEPTAVDFGELISEREEFKMSKNMRMIQRMKN